MSTYRLHGELEVDTVGHAETIRDAIALNVGSGIPGLTVRVTPGEGEDPPTLALDWVHSEFDEASRTNLVDWMKVNIREHPVRRTWIKRWWVCWHRHVAMGQKKDYLNSEYQEVN